MYAIRSYYEKEKGKKHDGKHKKKGRKEFRFTAATADKYELYQLSVQSAPEDVEFLTGVRNNFV